MKVSDDYLPRSRGDNPCAESVVARAAATAIQCVEETRPSLHLGPTTAEHPDFDEEALERGLSGLYHEAAE